MAKTCNKLVRLDIDEVLIDNETLIELAKKCPEMKHLCLYTCQDIQDSGIFIFGYKSLIFPGIKTVADNCHKLVNLNLFRCHQLTDSALEYLTSGCPDLALLDLSYTMITDIGIISLSKLQKLHTLNVQGCKLLTDSGIGKLTRNLPALVNLDVSKTGVTMDAIYMPSRFSGLTISNRHFHGVFPQKLKGDSL